MKTIFRSIILLVFPFSCYLSNNAPSEENVNNEMQIDSSWIHEEEKSERILQSKRDSFAMVMQKENFSFYCTENCNGMPTIITEKDYKKGRYKAFDIVKTYNVNLQQLILNFSVIINCGFELISEIEKKNDRMTIKLETIDNSLLDCECKFSYKLTINNCKSEPKRIDIKVKSPYKD